MSVNIKAVLIPAHRDIENSGIIINAISACQLHNHAVRIGNHRIGKLPASFRCRELYHTAVYAAYPCESNDSLPIQGAVHDLKCSFQEVYFPAKECTSRELVRTHLYSFLSIIELRRECQFTVTAYLIMYHPQRIKHPKRIVPSIKLRI